MPFIGKWDRTYLYIAVFFLLITPSHVLGVIEGNAPYTFLLADLILSFTFILLYKLQIEYQSLFILISCFLFSLYMVIIGSNNISASLAIFSMGAVMFLKDLKISPLTIIICLGLSTSLIFVSLNIHNSNVFDALNFLYLCVLIVCVFIERFKSFFITIDIKEKYKLTKEEYKIIKLMSVEPSPSNKELAHDMDMAYSTMTKRLDGIYDKFNLTSSGNRKVDLIIKLSKEGFI